MSRVPGLLTLLAALPLAFAVSGCSCEEPEPVAPNVVVAQPGQQPPAQPAAAQAQGRQAPEERQVGDSILHAPGDYLTTTVVTVPRRIKRDLGDALTNKEVQEFNALEGRNPYSLKELEEWRGAPLPEAPKGYTYKYNSTSGQVSVVPID